LAFQECYLAADSKGEGEGDGEGGRELTFTVFDLALCSDSTHFAIIIPYCVLPSVIYDTAIFYITCVIANISKKP
jgi:hypothetical protein